MPITSRWTITIPDISIPSLVFTSPTHPISDEKPALLDAEDPSHYLTLHTYRLWSQRLAAGLLRNGLEKGGRVLLFSGNNLAFPVVFMGIVMAGGIFTGANPGYIARELAHQLKDSGATYLLCSSASLDTGIDAAAQINFPKSRIFVFDDTPLTGKHVGSQLGCPHWSTLLASVEEGSKYHWSSCSTPEESSQTIALNYSSGTTGVPKGVEITHKNYVANTLQTQQNSNLTPFRTEERATDNWLCFLPMYHAMAQTYYVVFAPIDSIPVYIMSKFDFVKMLDYVQKYRISHLMLVPPVAVALAKHPSVRAGNWDLSSVRHVNSGAAPLGREVSKELESLWVGTPQANTINVRQGWGMTEATCLVLGCDPRRKYTTPTVGELVANCEAKIMNDEATAEMPRGQRGEIWVRAPNVMKGYWRNEKATKETLTEDGWLMTGDICYVDENGLFYIVDRKKELIKVKGNQVAPAELEALLLDHPAIADAAVIGVPKDGDEAPRAYVVLGPGKQASPREITSFVEKRVSKTKRITGGVHFIDAIPKNPSGKILRKVLREKAQKENTSTPKL